MRAFRLAYDGRPYHGFQRQPSVPTVEDALLDALRDLDVLAAADTPDGYAAAGRTDAGVSALAQTVAFECPGWCTPRALNGTLPPTIRAWAAADVHSEFHATHDAVHREYRYHLYAPEAGRETPTAPAVDEQRVRDALDALAGEHDFHNLTPDETNTVRNLSTGIRRDGDFLVISVTAGGFARELVRRLVSLVHAIGTGDAPLAKVDRVLAAEPLEGSEGVGPAPATPLVLTDVEYPGVDFTTDDAAAESAREVFDRRRIDALRAARATGEILDGVPTSDG